MKIRVRRWLIRGVVAVLVLALLGALWVAYDRWAGRREWEEYRVVALARGEKLSFRDYVPSPIPPQENYVSGTLFERAAVERVEGLEQKRPLHLPGLKNFRAGEPLVERVSEIKKAMLLAGWLKEERVPAEDGRAVLLGLERFRQELEELRAARSRPLSCFPQSGQPPPKTAFSGLSPALEVSSLLTMRIEAQLAVGDVAGALEDQRDQLRLYRAMIQEPAMIAGLFRQVVLLNGYRSIDAGLAAHLWREEDLRAIEDLLAGIDMAGDARQTFASERGFINDASEAMRSDSFWKQMAQTQGVDMMGELPRGWRLALILVSGDPWRRQVKENRVLDHRVAQFRAGCDGAYQHALPTELVVGDTLATMTGTVGDRYVAYEMARRQTRLVAVLERFRRAHGAFPKKLEALVPQWMAAIPRDVIDGAPIRYRLLEDGKFRLYSVGANGRDDGGSATIVATEKGTFKAEDWVWGEPWKK